MTQLTAEQLEQYSPSVRRTLGRPRPRWRGTMHKWAFLLSLPVGAAAVIFTRGGLDRVAMAFFAAGTVIMYGISARVHLRIEPPAKLQVLFNLDHTAIFLCIATGATAIALTALDGGQRIFLLVAYWIGAAIGISAVWLPFHPPKGLMNGLFLILGWTAIPTGPALLDGSGWTGLGLLLFGAAFYTVGAIVVGTQRPDPWPETFGYHEVWHLFVVVASSIHYGLVFFVLTRT